MRPTSHTAPLAALPKLAAYWWAKASCHWGVVAREGGNEDAADFANNHWQGQAVDTARQLKMLLGG